MEEDLTIEEKQNDPRYSANFVGEFIKIIIVNGTSLFVVWHLTVAIHTTFDLGLGWYSIFIVTIVMFSVMFFFGWKMWDLVDGKFQPTLRNGKLGQLQNQVIEWSIKFAFYGFVALMAYAAITGL